MRARHFLALFAAGLTVVVAAGCDGNNTGTGGDAGSGGSEGGSGGTGGTMTTTTGMPTTTGTGGTGPMGDGCDSFEDADTNPECATEVFKPGDQLQPTVGELLPIDADNDYYKFTGSAGQALFIFTIAKTDQSSPDPFAEGYPDLVITLYDQNKNQIAQNDDPIPRTTQDSSLYTVLPADGTYYIKVEEFCQVIGAASPGCDAAYFDAIIEPLYGLVVTELDGAEDGTVFEGTDTDMAQPIESTEYVENTAGTGYYAIPVMGTFKDGTDVDAYTFTVPNAIPVSNDPMYDGREVAVIEVFPTGMDGNGSAVPTGKVWIEDSNGAIVGQVDGTKLDPIDGYALEAPIKFGEQYTLKVQAGGAASAGGNNFYYVYHYRNGSNPAEKGDVDMSTNNNTLATAETLKANTSTGGYAGGFISGDITAGDVDYFVLESKPDTGDMVFATCSAQRAGSGLRGLKLTLIDADTGANIPGATATETDSASASLGNMGAALGNTTNVALKVETTMGQDANVAGTYYSCGVVFIPPMP